MGNLRSGIISELIEKEISYTVELDGRGRLVIPASVRAQLDLGEGDKLLLTLEGNKTVRLTSLRPNISRFNGILKRVRRKRSLVDELIAERRAESLNE
jgi:AbrB family looped-hinge helix DNA binding protein